MLNPLNVGRAVLKAIPVVILSFAWGFYTGERVGRNIGTINGYMKGTGDALGRMVKLSDAMVTRIASRE